MSYWNAKYPNDLGEYEITFGSKSRETTKAVEKVCTAVMDGLVESPDDVEVVVHARWTFKSLDQIAPCCSNCEMQSIMMYPNCPYCRAKMENGRLPNE